MRETKLIIAGSRGIEPSYGFIISAIKMFGLDEYDITEVVSGGADGVDKCGETFAENNGIPIKSFKPDYEKYEKNPKYAPIARNKEMADYSDAALVIHNGSKGSANMIAEMKKLGKPVYQVRLIWK